MCLKHVNYPGRYVRFKQTLYLACGVLRDSCKAIENDLMRKFKRSFLPAYDKLNYRGV